MKDFETHDFNDDRLNELRKHVNKHEDEKTERLNPNKPGGKYLRRFATGLDCVDPAGFPEKRNGRSEVFNDYVWDTSKDIQTVVVAILAWGGMHDSNRASLLKMKSKRWLVVCRKIRRGELNRFKAFDAFAELRSQKMLNGMGPAFFTKLIYFLMPKDEDKSKGAFILDQWAGASVNFLSDSNVVLLDRTDKAVWKVEKENSEEVVRLKPQPTSWHVSDLNTAEDYDSFCIMMYRLAQELGLSHEQLDRELMSKDKRSKGTWREYLTGPRES